MPKLLFSERIHPELTFDDAFLVPHNPILDRLFDCASPQEIDTLMTVHEKAVGARQESWNYIRSNRQKANPILQEGALNAHKKFRSIVLDLALNYPSIRKNYSRDEVDFHPMDGFGNTPIVVANMNNVTGKRMAEAAGMMGGNAAIPQDKEDAELSIIADHLHSRDVRYLTPVAVGPDTKVHELKKFLQKRPISTAIVTDNGKEDGFFLGQIKLQSADDSAGLPGIVPQGINEDSSIRPFIRPKDSIVTLSEGATTEEMMRFLDDKPLHFIPIVTADGRVKGVMTKTMASLQWRYRPHTDENYGGLAMLGTVGALNRDPIDRVKTLVGIGVRGIIFDTAHFDQGDQVYRNVEEARNCIEQLGGKVTLIAGNVVTPSATRDIFAAGADIAKVGIGPGAMCSTRMETGVGRPQLSAILKTARAAKEMGRRLSLRG